MDGYKPIEDYGMIGNMRTVALISQTDASIDYMCYPNFDSPTIFARLLDSKHGGYFSIGPDPAPDLLTKQLYLTDSNILITRYSSENGVGQITDFFPVLRDKGRPHFLVRKVEVVRGSMSFNVSCRPCFDYGRDAHEVSFKDSSAIFSCSTHQITLRYLNGSTKWESVDGGKSVQTTVCLEEGQTFTIVLGCTASFEDADQADYSSAVISCLPFSQVITDQWLSETQSFWREWLSQCTYTGRWREIVYRSALALKLLTDERTGAMVAAPTTSIPEDSWKSHGSAHSSDAARNWDYRYTWIRDAAFTVYAFLRIGFTHEPKAFMGWIEQRCKDLERIGSDEGLRVLYRIDGKHPSEFPEAYTESILNHLEGYRGHGPVRIGNAAADQCQLDIYGELMDSVYLCDKYVSPISWSFWRAIQTAIINPVIRRRSMPDHGIWEIRGGPKEYVHSKVMAWVTLDRAIRLAEKRSLPGEIILWRSE